MSADGNAANRYRPGIVAINFIRTMRKYYWRLYVAGADEGVPWVGGTAGRKSPPVISCLRLCRLGNGHRRNLGYLRLILGVPDMSGGDPCGPDWDTPIVFRDCWEIEE